MLSESYSERVGDNFLGVPAVGILRATIGSPFCPQNGWAVFQPAPRNLSRTILNQAVWPISTGVPMPFGTLNDPSKLVLLEDGKPVPSQWTVRATWTPGEPTSVKWLGLDFLAHYEGGKPKDYRIKNFSTGKGGDGGEEGSRGVLPYAPTIKTTETADPRGLTTSPRFPASPSWR